MKVIRNLLVALIGAAALIPTVGYALPSLQLFVALTPDGGTLRPPPGTYAGPVVIDRPITLDGEGQVTIDAEGEGTVLTVTADGAVVRGLRLTNSGDSFDQVDAGLLLKADGTTVEDNVIDHTLFGIHLSQANGNLIRQNRISSKPIPLKMRGDGIRMWNSHDNRIAANTIADVRDIFITYSHGNRISSNRISRSGVGMQFVFSPDNRIQGNSFDANQTGIVVLYSDNLAIRGNRIRHSRDIAGSAFALKESSQVIIEGNEVLHCAVGMAANAPVHPDNIFYLRRNRFAYNDIAMYFYGEKGGHIIHDNRFEKNLLLMAVTASSAARENDWQGNYWDEYSGFDRDGDGLGDTPYEFVSYSDRIWVDRPMTRFFRGSPVLEMVDFVERLAPFSKPQIILRDPAPRMR